MEILTDDNIAIQPRLRSGAAKQYPVNYYPHSIMFHKGYLYLTSVGGRPIAPHTSTKSCLSRIDPETGKIISSYTAGPYKWGLPGNGGTGGLNGFDIQNNIAYCANNHYGDGSCEMIAVDLSRMKEIARVKLGSGVCRHAVFVDGYIWVTVDGAQQVKRINARTWGIDLTIPTPAKPFRMAAHSGSLWIACFDASKVIRINPVNGETLAEIKTHHGPNWFGTDEEYVYIANYNGNSVQAIDPSKNRITLTYKLSKDYPHHPLPLYNELWVACSGSHKIKIFDKKTGALKETKSVGQNPPSLCFDGTCVWHPCGNVERLERHIVDLYYPRQD